VQLSQNFFFWMVLGFKLSTLNLLGRHPTTWVMPPALFALVIFQIGSCCLCLDQPGPWSSCLHSLWSWGDKANATTSS
jgi:hypothetical protein